MSVEVVTDADLHFKIARTHAVVYFWAPWCGPCKTFSPIFEKSAEAVQENLLGIGFYKVNIDNSPESAKTYNVKSVPTIVIFQNSSTVKKLTGPRSKRKLLLELADFM